MLRFDFEEKKVLTLHGLVLATLVSQTTCVLRMVFASPRGDRKKQLLLCTTIVYAHRSLSASVYEFPYIFADNALAQVYYESKAVAIC